MIAIVQEAVKELSRFEKWIDGIDLGIKFLGGLVIIFGSWLSFRQYADQRNRELDQREQELRMKVFDRELDLYSRASTAASRIAVAAEKKTKNEAAEQEFWELYWGPLCIIETRPVEGAMVRLGDALQRRDKAESEMAKQAAGTPQQTAADVSQQNAAAEELKELSYALAQEVRDFLKTQYKAHAKNPSVDF